MIRYIAAGFILACFAVLSARAEPMESLAVSPDGRGFVFQPSGRPFIPWGFNYDHDESNRLLEDYWESEWPKVESDFAEMKALGANVVRIHLQFGKFMRSASEPNPDALARLEKLVALAERTGLYLDITGLGCYHKKDVPPWYDALDEAARWDAQAAFWRAVASRCAASPAIFFYDLMNEPVVPGQGDLRTDWLGLPFGDKTFVQFITLETGDRARHDVARAWIDKLVAAIRDVDKRHFVSVGLVDWSLDRPGLSSGFIPEKIAPSLDFLCVHIYPERGKIDEALATLDGFNVGKPVIIEETFALKCSVKEFDRFVESSRGRAAGWIGFYWGRTIEELETAPKRTIAEAMTLNWLRYFRDNAPTR